MRLRCYCCGDEIRDEIIVLVNPADDIDRAFTFKREHANRAEGSVLLVRVETIGASVEFGDDIAKEGVEGVKDGVERQKDEFDAVEELAKQYRRIQLTPIVDDDYSEVRHDYEHALKGLIAALEANNRIRGKR